MKKKMLIAALMLLGVVCIMKAQNETDTNGTLVVPLVYDNIECGFNGLFVVQKANKKGVVNSDGKIIVPIQYDYVKIGGRDYDYDCSLIVVGNIIGKNDEEGEIRNYGLYNNNGTMISSLGKYKSIYCRHGDVAEVEIVRLDSVYYDGKLEIEELDRKYGVMLSDGTLLAPYEDVSIERNGLIVVEKNRKYGVINSKGGSILPTKYRYIRICDNGFIKVALGSFDEEKYGIFDKEGKEIVPIGKYEYVDVKRSCIRVKQNGKQGFLNLKGVELFPIGKYEISSEEMCEDEIHSYIYVSSNKQRGAISCNGKVIVPIGKYSDFKIGDNSLAVVKSNGKYGVIDGNGKIVIPMGKYDELRLLKGVIVYKGRNGKYGILDRNGRQIVNAELTFVGIQINGLIDVFKEDMYGIVNQNGHLVIPYGNYKNTGWVNNVGYVQSEEGMLYFDSKGNVLATPEMYKKCEEKYEELDGPVPVDTDSSKGLFVVTSNGKKGVVRMW